MSTKIYVGFKFPLSELDRFQKECNDHLMAKYRKRMQAIHAATDKMSETIKIFNGDQCSILYTFYLRGDTVYGHCGGAIAYLYKPEWVEDYSYWNNTDQPEEIPESEWDERSKFWDKALDYENQCYRLQWEVMGEFAPNLYLLLNELKAGES